MKAVSGQKIDGILPVDKPQDWTSHDVCAFVRKRFRVKKVGHAGTLDPSATGLLVLLLGRATKASGQLTGCDKVYEGQMKLGVETTTHDITGDVLNEAAWEHVTLDGVKEKVRDFTGTLAQTPPMVSALKHKGVRLYKLARKGKTVPREAREVSVHEFNIHKMEGPFIDFDVKVSKGTYVRTLVHDLGKALGTCAALSALRRTQSGDLTLKNAVTIEDLKVMTPDELAKKTFPVYSVLPLLTS